MPSGVNLANIAIVLVQPNISENIGAAARAMCNMGLRRLILVNPPRCDLTRVCKMATHAALDVVEEMEVYAGLPEALLDEWIAALGLQPLVNRRGTTWRRLDDAPGFSTLGTVWHTWLAFPGRFRG